MWPSLAALSQFCGHLGVSPVGCGHSQGVSSSSLAGTGHRCLPTLPSPSSWALLAGPVLCPGLCRGGGVCRLAFGMPLCPLVRGPPLPCVLPSSCSARSLWAGLAPQAPPAPCPNALLTQLCLPGWHSRGRTLRSWTLGCQCRTCGTPRASRPSTGTSLTAVALSRRMSSASEGLGPAGHYQP